MKFALVSGKREEARPETHGTCLSCGGPVVAKCGEIRVYHWAHKSGRLCDPWWESETDWHRKWKNQFPAPWQEHVHRAEDGEKHIADVKTNHGWVIEFQRSYLKPVERRSRDSFYQKLIWVVDGLRRQRDLIQFQNAWNDGIDIAGRSGVRKIVPDGARLLNEWLGSPSQVFIDFGSPEVIWWLLSKRRNHPIYIAPFSRTQFVHIHLGGEDQSINEFEKFVADIGRLISQYEEAQARRIQMNRIFPVPPRSRRRL